MAAEAVKVIVRCRPMNSREKDLKCKTVVSTDPDLYQCSITNAGDSTAPPKTFSFDGVYFVDSNTETIYNDIAYPLVEGVLEGYNGTVFAYGQTGCGKSFTMQGIQKPAAQRGIIPRAFEHIFEAISTAENMKYLVHASYLEIYNEEIRDLLGKDSRKKLELKEHPEKGVYVVDLSQHPVHDVSQCECLMDRGWRNRAVGATLMNADSSRSHSIFTISLEMMDLGGRTDEKQHIRKGKLNLVDLAGSERQAKTGATGERLKEATKINLSLSALGNVISALVDGKSKHIPYRDSKLTRLLQDSLGGNTKTLMVACISPADNNYDETLSTLRYANRAKNIKNKPKINEDPKDTMLREYQTEIRKLQEMLENHKNAANTVVTTVVPDEGKIEEERQKVRKEYEARMQEMQKQFEKEKEGKEKLQSDVDKLKAHYEHQLTKINEKVKKSEEQPKKKDIIVPNGVKKEQHKENNENLNTMQQEALARLQRLEEIMVGGEKAHDKELKEKRQKKKKAAEKRVALAARSGDDDDESIQKVYDNIQDELKVKTDHLRKAKQKIKALEREVSDLQSEFQSDRTDYLETIRKQEQQIKLLQQIMEKIQPTIRKDCNYCSIEKIKKEAVWSDDTQQWRLPDLTVQKTKLPPPGPGSIMSLPTHGTGPGPGPGPGGTSPNNANGNLLSTSGVNVGATTGQGLGQGGVNGMAGAAGQGRIHPGGRVPSRTAPARLILDPDDEENDILIKKLERSEQEDIAGNYFKPKRANELLQKAQEDASRVISKWKAASMPSNYSPPADFAQQRQQRGIATNLVGGGLGTNAINGHHHANGSSGMTNGSLSHSWGNLTNGNSNVGHHNGWIGNGVSSSPEMSLRKPTRLEALPTLERRARKKHKDLNTMDVI